MSSKKTTYTKRYDYIVSYEKYKEKKWFMTFKEAVQFAKENNSVDDISYDEPNFSDNYYEGWEWLCMSEEEMKKFISSKNKYKSTLCNPNNDKIWINRTYFSTISPKYTEYRVVDIMIQEDFFLKYLPPNIKSAYNNLNSNN